MNHPIQNDNFSANAKPRGCTWLRLRQASRCLTQRYDQHLRSSGLKITQFSLLATLASGEQFTMSTLAARMLMDRTTLTRNLKPLLDAGLVHMAAGSDARSRNIGISADGRRTFDAAHPLWRDAQKEIQGLIGSDTLSLLHDIVDRSLAILDTRDRNTDDCSDDQQEVPVCPLPPSFPHSTSESTA